ncbi:carbon catabolite repressor protein 4 homolog 4 isoform X2 [Mangifera indica]|nr:carbon catabolite repressor protein 4 homolog 4 isoform X2 [Mangifera indica]
MSTKPALASPKFISVEGGDIHSRSKSDGVNFSLVSYNILAQVYVKSSLFPHSPSACLKWKNRSKAILTVLKNFDADFLCIQELDESDFYKANLKTDGYSSIYIQRSGQKRDGCGIFYKDNRAELLVEERIEYNDLAKSLQNENISYGNKQNDIPTIEDEDDDPKNGSSSKNNTSEDHGDLNDPYVRLKRDCVGIMAAFRLKGPFDHVVILANTHLYWDPELADVKLAQAKYLLSRLAQFKTLVSDRHECAPSVFLAGDFNSVPNDKVYKYLTSGYSSSETLAEHTEELPIPLCSVYAVTRGEPAFTNCTPDFTDTLDYIFFSPADCLKPISTLELPNSDSPEVAGCLPNYYHPSDHLPIGAEFEITR